jgi:hypothetical protein
MANGNRGTNPPKSKTRRTKGRHRAQLLATIAIWWASAQKVYEVAGVLSDRIHA